MVEHSEWNNHIWSAALARLDQHLELATFSGLTRLAINISFYEDWAVEDPAHIPPPMPMTKGRDILHFTFDYEDCSFRVYDWERCRIKP
jgi:hypothetical protein